MSCYDLRDLLGVPGGSYRILTTLKGILRVGSFFQGPRCLLRLWRAVRCGRVPKEFLETLQGVNILRVSWSITL